MHPRLRATVAWGLSLALAACAAATSGGPASGPGRPRDTQYSTRAKLFLVQAQSADSARALELNQRALQEALVGIREDSTNAQHYFLAGQAYARLGQYAEADSMWDKAERLYPPYAQELELEREQAYVNAFNAGVAAYQNGNPDRAIELWQQAIALYDKRPDAFFNLGVAYEQQDRAADALQMYRRAIEAGRAQPSRQLSPEEQQQRQETVRNASERYVSLAIEQRRYNEAESILRELIQQDSANFALQVRLAQVLSATNRSAAAESIYQRLFNRPNLTPEQNFELGVAFFAANDFARAAEVFRRVTQAWPYSRDAWFNLAVSLYRAQRFADLVPAAQRLLELDPLNENAALLLVQAYRQLNRQQDLVREVERLDRQPILIDQLQLRLQTNRATVVGTAKGHRAARGSPIRLRFTFYADGQAIGTQDVTINAPERDQTTSFQVSIATQENQRVTGYRYELVR